MRALGTLTRWQLAFRSRSNCGIADDTGEIDAQWITLKSGPLYRRLCCKSRQYESQLSNAEALDIFRRGGPRQIGQSQPAAFLFAFKKASLAKTCDELALARILPRRHFRVLQHNLVDNGPSRLRQAHQPWATSGHPRARRAGHRSRRFKRRVIAKAEWTKRRRIHVPLFAEARSIASNSVSLKCQPSASRLALA